MESPNAIEGSSWEGQERVLLAHSYRCVSAWLTDFRADLTVVEIDDRPHKVPRKWRRGQTRSDGGRGPGVSSRPLVAGGGARIGGGE